MRGEAKDRAMAIAALSPTALLSWFLWREVAIDPLTAPAMLLDRGLQMLSIVFVVAILLVAMAPTKTALYASLFGGLLGIAMGVSVFLTAVVRPPTDWRMALFSVVVAAAACWVLWRYTTQLGWLRPTSSKVLATLLASGVGLLQFWNGASFLPGRTEVNVTQSVTTEFIDESRGILRYTATNLSDARALVIVSQLSVCWWTPLEEVDHDLSTIRDKANCQVERPITARSWIPGGAALDWQVAIVPPPNRPRMTVKARVAVARGDRLRLSSEPGATTEYVVVGECGSVVAHHLEEESRVKGVAQTDKYLVYADEDRDGGTNYYFYSGSSIACPYEDTARLMQYFGVSEQTVIHQSWAEPSGQAG